jgi:hypothetical protein
LHNRAVFEIPGMLQSILEKSRVANSQTAAIA